MIKPAAALLFMLGATLVASTTFAADTHFGADRHLARGLTCESCHGKNMDKKNPEIPTIDTCTGCHNTKALVEKTKNVKPTNPHMSPHYQDTLDCINCHVQHGQPENFCNQCHKFDFKVR
ncbi:MAG: cytochrome c3 family protein [Sutterella sp.]|nr:cytochrome c3 family protein [Sutterella sp.]